MKYNIIADIGIKPMNEIINKYVMPSLEKYEKQDTRYSSEMPWVESKTIEEVKESYVFYTKSVEKNIERKLKHLPVEIKQSELVKNAEVLDIIIDED